MVIGVPKEIKTQEARVALLPSAAYQLIQRGHQVLVEKNAGVGSGYPDHEYEQAGAKDKQIQRNQRQTTTPPLRGQLS